jgi:hypothetical protein
MINASFTANDLLAAVLSYLFERGILARRETLKAMSDNLLASGLEYVWRAATINCSEVGPSKHVKAS